MWLHEEAKEELAGIIAGISDNIRENGAPNFYATELLGRFVLKSTGGYASDNFDVEITVTTHMEAAEDRSQPERSK